MKRRQFPIILRDVMMIKKSQGQSFDRVDLFFSRRLFSRGQQSAAEAEQRNEVEVQMEDSESHDKLRILLLCN